MSGIFKKFRPADITVTPYTAHKEYLVYMSSHTGSYHEHTYEQFRVRDHVITSSANTWVGEVSLSVYAYDSEFDGTDFYDTQYGKYGAILSESAHPRTTNRWFKRAVHDSLQGMYYTNPDDPCYTLDNSGYDKEFRVLNKTCQLLSVPQRMMGDCIKKGSVKIQSGSGANRITLYDDGYGNLYDNELTGSVASGSIVTSQSVGYISQSLLAFNFNDMYNRSGEKLNATSINFNATMKRGDYTKANKGYKFDMRNNTRFFERSKYSNWVKAYNITPDTSSAGDGTHIKFDGKTPGMGINTSAATESRTISKNSSMMKIEHGRHLDFSRDDDYSITMRISASQDQPSNESHHNYIMSKLENGKKGSFPFSVRFCNENANGSGAAVGIKGHRGGIQVAVSDGVVETHVNTTGSITGSNEFFDVAFVKSGSAIKLYVNAELQETQTLHTPSTGSTKEISNKGKIVIGATTKWVGQYIKEKSGSFNYGTRVKPKIEYDRNFKGGISNIMMFNKALSAPEIAYGHATKNEFTNLVGNVFYNHGLVTLTSISDRYYNTTNGSMLSECTLSFKNCHEIFEHEHSCHVKEREFLYTMNPSIIKNHKEGTIKTFCTTSAWSPYVTTIGLYNEQAQLIAIGKLSSPLKKSADYDTTYVVRYDT